MRSSLGRAIWATAVCFAIAAFVTVREWTYHQDHRFRPGPSLEIAALALAVTVLAGVVVWMLTVQERK